MSGLTAPGRALVPLAWALALVLTAALLLGPAPARAGTFSVGETEVETTDPTSVNFRLAVETSALLESAVFRYKVLNPDGNVGGFGDADFAPTRKTDVTFELETITAQRYIPVGSKFVIEWELTDKDGTVTVTPEERFIFLDGRYEWQSSTEDGTTVFWYGDDDSKAVEVLGQVAAALREGERLLQAEVPYPVRVVVWRSEDEGSLAMRPRGETFDALTLTGGLRVAPDLLFVFDADIDTVRHETGHLVTKVAGDGPFTSVPAWLDEGTAMYLQVTVGAGREAALDRAIRTDTTLNLRSLVSPPNNPSLVNLFYGQSWSTVDLLISEFGEAEFARLYATVKAGSTADMALLEVYGFDANGLYNLWRERQGLETIEFAPVAAGTAAPVADATRTPLGIPTAVPVAPQSGSRTGGESGSSGSSGSSPGSSPSSPAPESASEGQGSVLVIGVAAGMIVLMLLVAMVVLLRRRPEGG